MDCSSLNATQALAGLRISGGQRSSRTPSFGESRQSWKTSTIKEEPNNDCSIQFTQENRNEKKTSQEECLSEANKKHSKAYHNLPLHSPNQVESKPMLHRSVEKTASKENSIKEQVNAVDHYLKNSTPTWNNHNFNRPIKSKVAGYSNKKPYTPYQPDPYVTELKALVYCSSEEVVETLSQPEQKFEKFINNLPHQSLFLALKVLKKVSECTELHEKKKQIINVACNPKFLEYFATRIVQGKKMDGCDLKYLLQHMVIFFETILNVMPISTIDQVFSHIVGCFMCAKELKFHSDVFIEEAVLKKFENLIEKVEKLRICHGADNLDSTWSFVDFLKVRPFINNFRSVRVVPSACEILDKTVPLLRPNIVNGRYMGVEHYLDTQFRLLREDFIRPLRDGIANFRSSGFTKSKSGDCSIRTYSNVTFERNFSVEQQDDQDDTKPAMRTAIGTKVIFAANHRSKLRNIDWRVSKKLMHGSLVCFTKNNFETLLFATVSERAVKYLQNGYLYVEFCTDPNENIYDSSYLMVESEVYFEPYSHVLKTLQSLNSLSLPMSQYLVELTTEDDVPRYSNMPENAQYTLQGVENQTFTVTLTDDDTWPTPSLLGLDPSQFEALKVGLSQELAVIQGPPGTGKTYMGLRITQALLASPQKSYRTGPILVVCLTNHALDQFLEGVAKYTCQLVRVGGQSKSEDMEEYNIKHMRHYSKFDMEIIVPIREQIQSLQLQIAQIGKYLQSIQGSYPVGITAFSTLKAFGVVPDEAVRDLSGGRFLIWLCLSFSKSVDTFQQFDFELTLNDISYELKEAEKCNSNGQNDEFLTHYLSYLHVLYDAMMANLKDSTAATTEQAAFWLNRCGGNLWKLVPEQRWKLYWLWVSQLERKLELETSRLNTQCSYLRQRMEKVKRSVELEVMRGSDVVGMTTTCAARLHEQLKDLAPEILIVEEAAEVLESHIVACLTKSCKHLILIGDHKQLRPSTSVYQLARQFDLDVSLFERLVRNRGQCVTLGVQHRMSPCIASLVTPSIYEQLDNAASVHRYEQVRGMRQRLFFVSHCHPETQEAESNSHSNEYEARFVLGLCDHLVRQGYKHHQITILTTYTAQMFLLKKELQGWPGLRGVRITVVDNFQGEESDIVLLSLVRSNDRNNIGFLATENRVCVALSRARHALYMVGNMDCLASSSRLWRSIRATLQQQRALGPALPIRCQVHGNVTSFVQQAVQFKSLSPLGGCTQFCTAQLACGHSCNRFCHVEDHSVVKCQFPCERRCPLGHVCTKQCYEPCRCEVRLEKHLPSCNHITEIHCWEELVNLEDMMCGCQCSVNLPCGHICQRPCHINVDPQHSISLCTEPCKRTICLMNHPCPKKCHEKCEPCNVLMRKPKTCGHFVEMACHVNPRDVACSEKCERTLKCGHKCMRGCGVPCEPCVTMVSKTISECWHTTSLACSEKPTRDKCVAECERRLKCGHLCAMPCAQPCTVKCVQEVASATGSCGHLVPLLCWEKREGLRQVSDPRRCDRPCCAPLECGHLCGGSCGSCLQGKFHVPCRKTCGRTLVCGHSCPGPCFEPCLPCKQKCEFLCPHQACTKQCGEPCVPCQERCIRRCCHQACTRKCSELCDVPPCSEACLLSLVCGHPCVGMCGDPCPPLCAVCRPKDFLDSFLGQEPPQCAVRLVYIPSCSHSVEMTALERTISAGASLVGVLICPRCAEPMKNVPRYAGRIKKALLDVGRVKTKMFGSLCLVERERRELERQAANLLRKCKTNDIAVLVSSLESFRSSLLPKEGVPRSLLHQSTMHMKKTEYVVLESLVSIWQASIGDKELLSGALSGVLGALEGARLCLGQQQINDLTAELVRVSHLAKVCSHLNLEPLPRALRLCRGGWVKCPNNHPTLVTNKPRCGECNAEIDICAVKLMTG